MLNPCLCLLARSSLMPSCLSLLASSCVSLMAPLLSLPRHCAGCLARQQHQHDHQHDVYGHYWQRPVPGARVLVGGCTDTSSSTHTSPSGRPVHVHAASPHHHQASLRAWPQAHQSLRSYARSPAHVHHGDDAHHLGRDGTAHHQRDAHHPVPTLGPGYKPTPHRPGYLPAPPGRRALNLQYISQQNGLSFEPKFWKNANKEMDSHFDLTPSVRGSFRSDGSGQSQVRRPFSQLSFAGSNVFVVGHDQERLKMAYHPSVDSIQLPRRRGGVGELSWADRMRELPVLRAIHEPQASSWVRQTSNGVRATMPSRALRPSRLEPVPEAIYDSSGQVYRRGKSNFASKSKCKSCVCVQMYTRILIRM